MARRMLTDNAPVLLAPSEGSGSSEALVADPWLMYRGKEDLALKAETEAWLPAYASVRT